jgi:putative membrane protein
MIKRILRYLALNIAGLYVLPMVIPTVVVSGGVKTALIGGVTLTLVNIIAKPLVKIALLPINVITLGALSWISGVIMIYLMIYFVPNVSVSPFSFLGFNYNGFALPAVDFSLFWTIVLIALFFNAIYFFVGLLFDL